MKVLFVSSRDVKARDNGGAQCTNRNYLSVCELAGNENVVVKDLSHEEHLSVKRRILRRLYQYVGYYWGLSPQKLNDICFISSQFDSVFIDTSAYGLVARSLRRAGYGGRIITHFHNVEYIIQKQLTRTNPFLFYKMLLLHFNERQAVKYSDSIIVLNERDKRLIDHIYGTACAAIIPISLKDRVADLIEDKKEEVTSLPPTFIFVGNNWYANVHGLHWFVDNVLDNVNIRLQIAGSGMDELRDEFVHPRIEFLGFVEDLSSVLFAADFVVSPIFKGSGMKVKVCESLMYGKNIVGTTEAFSGYDLDFKKTGALCNTSDEFIAAINEFCEKPVRRFNEYARRKFVEKYSYEATLKTFREVLFA